MNPLDDIFSEIGLPTVRAVSSRRREQQSFTPEEQDSLLRRIGSTALSGIGAVGNLLDIPGSMVRDTISGHNPFDQLLSPFSGDNRQTGRDVLATWGVTTPNDPNAWEAADFGGFGAEVLLDPLTYATFGLSALGKGGQVAKNAGLMADLAKVAGKRVGPREARLTSTLDDLLSPRLGEEAATGAAWNIERGRKAATAAQALGIDDLASVADQPLGGLFGVGLPFQPPSAVYGSPAAGRKLDELGRRIQFAKIPGTDLAPVSALNRLLSAKTGDAASQVGQRDIMPDLFQGRKEARAAARGTVADLTTDLLSRGGPMADEDHSRALRRLYEGVDLPNTPELAQHVDKVRGVLDPMVSEAKEWGLHASELFDPRVNYFPRYLAQELRDKASGKARIVSTFDPQNVGRNEFLKGLGQGTDTIYQMLEHPEIKGLLDNGGKVDDISAAIERNFAADVPAQYVERTGGNSQMTHIAIGDRREALAKWFSDMDEPTRAAGVYGNHPMQDLAARVLGGKETMEVGKRILTQLADPDTLRQAVATSRTPGEFVPLKDVLGAIGFIPGTKDEGALKKFLTLAGQTTIDDKLISGAAQLPIPRDLAEDLTRYMQGFKGPEAANEIIKAVDSVTNLFKAGVTSPWPAFSVRNLFSGQWQNMAAGQWSAKSLAAANGVMRGKAADVLDIPIVQQELQRAGLAATPENAADVVRRLAYQHDVVGKYESLGANAAGNIPAGSTLADLVSEMPGGVLQGSGTPFQPSDALGMLRGGVGRNSAPPLSAGHPLLSGGELGKLPSTRQLPDMTPDDQTILAYARNTNGEFDRLSRAHADFSDGLRNLVGGGAISSTDAQLARAIFSQSNGMPVRNISFRSVDDIALPGAERAGFRLAGLAERMGLNGSPSHSITLARARAATTTPANAQLKVLLHEIGHVAYWQMDDALRSDFTKLFVSDPNAIRSYVSSVFKGKRDDDLFQKTVQYFTNDPAEFFSERFAHSLIDRKVPEGVLGRIVDVAKNILVQLIDRIRSAVGIDPTMRKRLDDIMDRAGGFDRSAPGWHVPKPAPVQAPFEAAPEKWWNLGDPKDADEFNFWSNSKGGQRSGDNYLKRFATGVVNPDGTQRRFDASAGYPIADDALSATTWNPLKAQVRGVGDAVETTFAPMAAGQHLGHYIEGLNRLTPFIENLRKGVDPAEAAARVAAAQVDYAGRNYTKFQNQVLFRAMPFGKFTTGMVPYTLRRLWEKPGGALAQTIRAENRASGGDAATPDYVSETAAIPLGQTPDGSNRYVTGFGLPLEDPLSFLGGGVRGGLMEAASRANPLLKAPLEWATGESFFQKGPQGGRDLEDLDPTVGRILSNIMGQEKPVDLPDAFEFILGNSPLARGLTTARTLTDPRKRDLAGALNLLTGVRVSDVSPAAQDAVIRERSTALMKELGAKSFARTYFPKDDVANMTPEQQAQAIRLQLLQNILADRAKERKAAAGK